MVASYLGITPESLSRVRKELVRKNNFLNIDQKTQMEFSKLVKGFEFSEEGHKIGHIDFNIVNGVMKITHTEVIKNILVGNCHRVVKTAVEYARHKT